MRTLVDYCELKFPKHWKIEKNIRGSFHFRDASVVKGEGYLVIISDEISKFEVSIEFENFAKGLSNIVEKRISDVNNPLRELIYKYTNIEVIIHKHYFEKNFDPQSKQFEKWDFSLVYRKNHNAFEAEKFSDIIISIILYLFPYEFDSEYEGEKFSDITTKYERSQLNRSLCLAYYGYNCTACGINLQEKYGDIARNHIQVHHLNPISAGGNIRPDPIKDFRPLCPNCHSIAHLRNPPLTIDEIKVQINGNANA